MKNYNLANTQEIKNALALRLEVLNNEAQALDFLANALQSFKRKNIDKYFKNHVEELSPKYAQQYTDYNRETHQEETTTKNWPVYSISIYKEHQNYGYNKVNLYLHGNRKISGAENYINFTFYPDYNLSTEEEKQACRNITPENLARLIKQEQERHAKTIAKVQKDFDNVEELTAQYNQARQAYDDILEAVHYYTRDQLTGKRDYNLSKIN